MPTFTDILARSDISVPDETLAELAVPILSGPQRQGDILFVPRAPLGAAEFEAFTPVPAKGVNLVVGEATGNAHILHNSGDPGSAVAFRRHESNDPNDLLLGVLHVPAGDTAYVIHTDEHGVNGIAPGTYLVKGKREYADEVRRVAD